MALTPYTTHWISSHVNDKHSTTKDDFDLFTASKRSCEKIMFSLVSVQKGGGVSIHTCAVSTHPPPALSTLHITNPRSTPSEEKLV